MTQISTHILDIGRGVPAAGVGVELLAAVAGGVGWMPLGHGRTDPDGRAAGLAASRPGGAQPGLHRLVFAVGAYQREAGTDPVFLEEAAINFNIADEERLHIPLLLSPYGLLDLQGVLMTATDTDLHGRIDQLAQIQSEVLGSGVTREVYTGAYVEATELVAAWMREVGLETRLDSVGNLFGRWVGSEPELPRLLTGSHFDTTLNAGRYDGVLGVLGAIDAVRRLQADGYQPRRSIEIVGFAGEEPRFGAGCIGSRAMVGTLRREDLDTMRDRNGVSIAEAMLGVGLDPEQLQAALFDDENVHMLVELHIEQGPELETGGIPIGVVERIAAPHDFRVRLEGEARHSGSTPMRLRHDALVGAAEIVVAVERLAKESSSGTTVGTVGILNLSPGAVNVIPGEVTMDIDIRDSQLAARHEVTDALLSEVRKIAERRELALSIVTTTQDEPAACDERIVAAVREAAAELELPARGIVSGAYHDAMVLGAKVPIGMIFVPSVAGLSHHPDEYTAPADLDHGVAVLAGTLRRLAA